jgi:hypothetical protein
MAVLYKIRDWGTIYENSESRKRDSLRWVATPNEHQGSGWGRMVANKRRIELFCAWNLIIQVASKCPERGTLGKNGHAYTSDDLAFKTGFPAAIFTLAFEFFSGESIRWLEKVEISSENEAGAELSRTMPNIAEGSAENGTGSDRKGSDRIEEKKKEEKHALAESVLLTDSEYLKLIAKIGSEEKTKLVIEFFSNKKLMKGYKYKSDYLAILDWGILAFGESEKKQAPQKAARVIPVYRPAPSEPLADPEAVAAIVRQTQAALSQKSKAMEVDA